MPQKPRRRLTRRSAPPRPTYPGAQGTATAGAGGAAATATASEGAQARRAPASSRSEEYIARQMPFLRNEMRRVGWVSIVCFGLLGVLAVVDRLQ